MSEATLPSHARLNRFLAILTLAWLAGLAAAVEDSELQATIQSASVTNGSARIELSVIRRRDRQYRHLSFYEYRTVSASGQRVIVLGEPITSATYSAFPSHGLDPSLTFVDQISFNLRPKSRPPTAQDFRILIMVTEYDLDDDTAGPQPVHALTTAWYPVSELAP